MQNIISMIKDLLKPLIKDLLKPFLIFLAGFLSSKRATQNKALKNEAKIIKDNLKFKQELDGTPTELKRKQLRDKYSKRVRD